MTLTMQNGGIPSLLTDVFTPDHLLGRDFIDSDIFPPRLGINVPPANIVETSKDYWLEIAAPGMNRKDFKLEIDEHRLSIAGVKTEKKEQKEGNGRSYARKEFSYSSFNRTFQVPENTKLDKIDARYENGILRIIIPKKQVTEVSAPHEIPIM